MQFKLISFANKVSCRSFKALYIRNEDTQKKVQDVRKLPAYLLLLCNSRIDLWQFLAHEIFFQILYKVSVRFRVISMSH
jgi:hypothetical protein